MLPQACWVSFKAHPVPNSTGERRERMAHIYIQSALFTGQSPAHESILRRAMKHPLESEDGGA